VAKGKEKLVSTTPQLPELPLLHSKGQVVAKVIIQNEGKVAKEINLSRH